MKTSGTQKIYRFFIIFTLLLLALCVLVPVLWVMIASLKDDSEFYSSPWALPKSINLKNFTDAWNKADMESYFFNSVTVTVTSLAILFITAVPAAYVLARYRFKGKRIISLVFMACLFVNVSYLVVPIFLMIKRLFIDTSSLPPKYNILFIFLIMVWTK